MDLAGRIVSRYLPPQRSRLVSTAPVEAALTAEMGAQILFRNSGKIFVAADSREIPIDSIRQSVTQYILQSMSWPAADVTIRLASCPDRFRVRNEPYSLRMSHDAAFDFRGTGRIGVEIEQRGRVVRSFQVGVQIQVKHPVCVATRTIKRNSALSAGDVTMVRMDISRMRNPAFFDPRQLTGRQTCRTIVRGRILDATMVRMPPAVEAGAAVRLLVVRGSTQIGAEGVSRQAGQIGDRIQVYCPATRKTLNGRIQADTSVVIESGRRKV